MVSVKRTPFRGGRNEYRDAARTRPRRTQPHGREHARPTRRGAGELRRRSRRDALEAATVPRCAADRQGSPLREAVHRRTGRETHRSEYATAGQSPRQVGSGYAPPGSVRAGVGRDPTDAGYSAVRRATRRRCRDALRRVGRTRDRRRQDGQRVRPGVPECPVGQGRSRHHR